MEFLLTPIILILFTAAIFLAVQYTKHVMLYVHKEQSNSRFFTYKRITKYTLRIIGVLILILIIKNLL
jgi:threonine/homoserine/homoserine lactone efflux protein